MTALIWDLDGTLLDSYKVIVESVLQVMGEAGIELDYELTHAALIAGSTKTFLAQYPDGDRLWARYVEVSTARDGEVRLMDGAREALAALKAGGAAQFVYSHKARTATRVLEELGIGTVFTYVLTSDEGLPRKPAPDGIEWLVRRFDLDKRRTFYIGDRPIDVECALRAGVRSVLFLPGTSPAVPTGREDIIVSDLREIPDEIERWEDR